MNTSKCPICGKPGIPDYFNEDVICPNCNSDLSVYRALHTVSLGDDISSEKTRKYKNLAIALPILAVLLMGVLSYFIYNIKMKEYNQQLEKTNITITELNDSISTLTAKIDGKNVDGSQYIEYEVIHNDSPWGIVHKFFPNCKDWETVSKEIAEANNIWDENAGKWKEIHPGQIIKIFNIK